MKQNLSETGSNWCFWKNIKIGLQNRSTKQEIGSDAAFKACMPIFI